METSTDILLLCPTGSRLYGLSHEGSDFDTYRVVSSLSGRRKNKTKHVIAGSTDDFTVDLKTFMYHAHTAQPQALEAMFTPVVKEDKLAGYRQGSMFRFRFCTNPTGNVFSWKAEMVSNSVVMLYVGH